jgi:ubiquinone/menaquinone biosynthesis C-methylase UbiE
MIDLASLHVKSNAKLVEMDATDIEYQDEVFDTIVDTFGLQSSYNPQKQYDEMKRVCKVISNLFRKEA